MGERRLWLSLAPVIAALILSAPLLAHHGNAAFESKVVSAKGTVVEWLWSNPHCLLKFDEKTDSGEVHHWVVETQAPANMIEVGWSKNSFKPGDEITVDIKPAKAGKFVGAISKVTLPDGKVLWAWGTGPNAGAITGRTPESSPNQ